MFEKFLKFFGENDIIKTSENPYKSFITSFSGRQFGDGLLTVFFNGDLKKWHANVYNAFPITQGEFVLFGHDWLGNCLGIATDGPSKGNVVIFEIGTAEILSTGCDFQTFLNNEIPNNGNASLSSIFYREWLNKKGTSVKYGRCIGYKIPLFMGGKDDITNLEDSDMDVYWSIISQVMAQIGTEE
jgi:hypothetical protein